jgi:hypothetical protein
LYSLVTNFLEPISYFIYVVAVALRFKADHSVTLKVLFLFYLLATVLMTNASLHVFTQVNNIWMYNLVLLAAILAIGFYAYTIFHAVQKRRVVLVLACGTVLYFIVRNFVFRHLYEIDSIGFVLLSISVTIFSFMYFHQILNHVTEAPAFYDFNSWLIAGYLLYYLGSFFIFLCFNYFTYKITIKNRMEDRLLLTTLWGVHNVFLFFSAAITLMGSVWTTYRNRSR